MISIFLLYGSTKGTAVQKLQYGTIHGLCSYLPPSIKSHAIYKNKVKFKLREKMKNS